MPGFETIVAFVGAAKAGIDTIDWVTSKLSGACSCVLEIDNNTDLPLVLASYHHDYGGFAHTPSSQIAPHSASVFGSVSKFGAGTQGYVVYKGVGFAVSFGWDNPLLGSNRCWSTLAGNNTAFRINEICGSGYQAAHMRCEVFDTYMRQSDWRWCSKCQGLFFGGSSYLGSGGGVCPKDGKPHTSSGSGNYLLVHNALMAPGQDQWRWCSKCQGMFFGGSPYMGVKGGVCPASKSAHTKDGSGNYTIGVDFPPGTFGQKSWRWCNKCQGLYFGGAPSAGIPSGCCPAGGAHDPTGSGDYELVWV